MDRRTCWQVLVVLLGASGGALASGDTRPTEQELRTLEELKTLRVHFAYDDTTLPSDGRDRLADVGRFVADERGLVVVIEGHADERGSEEYNLALGEQRAQAVRAYLEALGVQDGQVRVVSYGENRPVVEGHDETAWAQNRRVAFVPSGGLHGAPAPVVAAAAPAEPVRAVTTAGPATGKNANATRPSTAMTSAAGGRPRPPRWLGPALAALILPALLPVVPAVLAASYLGPQAWPHPSTGREPVVTSGKTLGLDRASGPANAMGALWSSLLHPEQRALSVPVLGVAAGVGGAAVLAAGAVAVAAAVVTAWSLLPSE